MAAAPFVRWKEAHLSDGMRSVRWIALASVSLAIAIGIALRASPMVVLGLTLAAWILLATASHLVQRLRNAPAGTPLWRVISSQPRSYWGMLIAHAGIGVFVVGVTLVKGFDVANDVSMQVGDTTSAGGYTFRLKELKD